MRVSIVLNFIVVAVALFLAARFALASNGSFAGRDPNEWAVATLVGDARSKEMLMTRDCGRDACELVLRLPRAAWPQVKNACLDAEICFAGDRLNFVANPGRRLQPGEPIAVSLHLLDGTRRQLVFQASLLATPKARPHGLGGRNRDAAAASGLRIKGGAALPP